MHTQKQFTFRKSDGAGGDDRTAELIRIYLDLIAEAPDGQAAVAVDRCANCSFLFTNPRLTPADLDRKYAEIASFDLAHRRKRGRPPHLEERRRRTTPFLLDLLPHTSASILDYGGAEGYLLSPLIDAGHRGYVADYIDYAREDDRVRYLGQQISEEVTNCGPYDLILLLHTLEHVTHPVELLQSLGELLTPTGKIYVEVPLGAWLEWAHLREPLTHINFFSEQSVVEAAEQAGLYPCHVSTDWQYVTQSEKTPCINLVVGNTPDPAFDRSAIRSGRRQMNPLHQLWPALSVNPRYYGKIAVKSLLS
ncbi:class I SAM-dependent methyltransferase [Neolewinella litorea]|uniref:class I SAM-dependent methyltransferase n=1 Tax=Neolewinella litorea TaxID=2562452 RepID=UPI001455E3CD|nr:class I SAM-dependent methyltransferase [Neolewinella litorea]